MASTFFSSRSPYPVFINYFPGDMSYALAIKIFHTLTKAHKGLRVFLNNVAPEPGDSVATETEDAILRAKLHIAIFSPSYAQSPCCLDELVLMIRSRTKVIPVFYDVEPFHLRWVNEGTGVYVDAFSKHEKQKTYKPQRLQVWKTALYYASLLYGYELKNTENEGMLSKSIVNHTLTVQLGSIQFNSMASISSASTASSETYSIGKAFDGVLPQPTIASSFSSLSYDVFINHKHTLPADIYHKLDSNGLGFSIPAKKSLFLIYSPKYKHSSWILSLDEQSFKLTAQNKIFSVIYVVRPSAKAYNTGKAFDSVMYISSRLVQLSSRPFNSMAPICFSSTASSEAYNIGKAFNGVLHRPLLVSSSSSITNLDVEHTLANIEKFLDGYMCISSSLVQISSRPFNSMAPICSSSTASSEAYNIGKAFNGVLPRPPLVSSSSSMTYDVFISHRGIDVKHTPAADIYHKLDSNGLRTFLDREELELGSSIPMVIEEAMLSAELHIAIITPNYAQSPWCLEELAFMCFMLKTGTTILPIFYDVEPADIECIGQDKGIYREDFRRYEEKDRYAPEKLREWKTALCIVSSIPRYMLKNPGCKLKNKEENNKLLESILSCVRFRLGRGC